MKKRYSWDDPALIVEHPALSPLHDLAGDYFEQAWAEKLAKGRPTRRPNLSIRLKLPGEPPARLLILPGWSKARQEILPRNLVLELTVGRIPARRRDEPVGAASVFIQTVEMRLGLDAQVCRKRRWSVKYGDEALARLLAGVDQFVADPMQAFANSSDHCCLCGRWLREEESRVRGIGPECHRYATVFRQWMESATV